VTRRPILPSLRWWEICATLAIGLLVRALHGADVGADDPQAAWFFVVVGIIWSALQTAWQVTSTVLSYALRWTLMSLRWAITNLGKAVASGLGKAAVYTAKVVGLVWRGLRYVFEPIFRVVGKTVSSIIGFLHRVFDPIISMLNKVRAWVLRIYNDWVKPVLTAIDIARRMFRLLAMLGFDWARAIDQALGRLSAKISFPFTYVISKLNEAINWINRILTLDGLLQRLTLMRSLIRDVKYTSQLFWNAQTKVYSGGEVEGMQLRHVLPKWEELENDYVNGIVHDDGPYAARANEFWLNFERQKNLPLGAPRTDLEGEELL
jgi:hypothetical protein